jgi:hypothetical protein
MKPQKRKITLKLYREDSPKFKYWKKKKLDGILNMR